MQLPPAVERYIENLSAEDSATLAGEILARIDPTKTNLDAFFESLKSADEGVSEELVSRAAQRADAE